MTDACKWASQDGAAGASLHSLAPTVRGHSTAPAWTTAEGWPERVRGAGQSPPRRRHITAPSYRWRSHRHRDRLCTLAAAPPATTLCHPGRRFSAGERWRLRVGMGGDLVAIGTTPPTLLSLPFPCISCLAVRCVRYRVPPGPTHAALGMRACCVRRSGCGQGGLRGMLTAMLTAKNREKCCPDCGAGCTRSV